MDLVFVLVFLIQTMRILGFWTGLHGFLHLNLVSEEENGKLTYMTRLL
jgi:hypothetical protein